MTETAILPDQKRGQAMGMVIFSSVMVSFSGLVIRMLEAADVWQIAVYRSLVIMALVWLVMLYRHGRGAIATVRRIGGAGVLAGLLLGGAGLSNLLAITNTTVANALFTLSAIPFFTAALAWVLLGERIRRLTAITMALAACGIVIMVIGSIGAGSLFGNIMALMTALCFSGYAILIRRHRGVEMLPLLLVSGGALAVTGADLARCALLAVFSGGASALMIAAARHLLAAELTLFMLLEFALGPLWVWLAIAETPGPGTLIGGGIVIGAVTLRALIELHTGRAARRRTPTRGMM